MQLIMSDEQQGLVLILHSQISPGFGAGGCLGWDSLGNWDEVMPTLGWVLGFFLACSKAGMAPVVSGQGWECCWELQEWEV